jgi:hypothetical protein
MECTKALTIAEAILAIVNFIDEFIPRDHFFAARSKKNLNVEDLSVLFDRLSAFMVIPPSTKTRLQPPEVSADAPALRDLALTCMQESRKLLDLFSDSWEKGEGISVQQRIPLNPHGSSSSSAMAHTALHQANLKTCAQRLTLEIQLIVR